MTPIADQMRRAYMRSGLTQEEIAARAGVSENTVHGLLRGRNVTVANLAAVAEVLGVQTVQVVSPIDRGDKIA